MPKGSQRHAFSLLKKRKEKMAWPACLTTTENKVSLCASIPAISYNLVQCRCIRNVWKKKKNFTWFFLFTGDVPKKKFRHFQTFISFFSPLFCLMDREGTFGANTLKGG